MSVVRVVAAMAVAVASSLLSCPQGRSQSASPAASSFLLFGGVDLWRYGDFFYGGTLWSPAGLDRDGFTLKLLLNGGRYSYDSGSLQTNVDGTMLSGAAMPGWRFVRGNLAVSVFAGPVAQDYRLSPDDPGSRLRGFYVGAQFGAEIWYQPAPNVMAALNGTLATIGPTGMLRSQFGFRAFDAIFVGPEAAALWCGDFQEWQIGAHLTGLRYNALEWSAGAGLARDSDHRSGPYLRLGVSARY